MRGARCPRSDPIANDFDRRVRDQGWRRIPTMRFFSKLIRDESGQDMVEYALLASFISIVAIVALRAIGPLVNTIYTNIQAALT